MADLSEDDLKLVLSIDPDEESLRKAVQQINAEVESARVSRVKLGVESGPDVLSRRIANERTMAEERRRAEQAEHAERVRQAGGQMGYMWEQMKKGMGGGGGTGALLGGILGGQGGGGMLGQIGGMAGEALGGPAGAMIGEALAKAIPGAIAAPARAATAAMEEVAKGLRGMEGPLGGVGAGLDLATSAFESVSGAVKGIPVLGEVLGPLLDTIGKLPGIFKSILETGTSLVAKLSPGVMKQFNVALEDAQATIGQAFLPVIQQMIPYIKELGTIIAQALPSDQEMRAMFGAVFESIKELVQEIAPLIGPVLKALTVGTKVLVDSLSLLVKAFKATYEAVRLMIQGMTLGLVDLNDVFGTKGGERGQASAARPASLSSIEEYQRKLQLETFQGGRDTGIKSIAENVGAMQARVDRMDQSLQKLSGDQFIAEQMYQAITRSRVPPSARDNVNVAESDPRNPSHPVRQFESGFNWAFGKVFGIKG